MLGRTVLPVYGFLLFFVAASFQNLKEARVRTAVGCLLLLFSGISVFRWVAWEGAASREPWSRPVAILKKELSESDILLTDVRLHPIPKYRFPEFRGQLEFYGGPGDVQADRFDATRTIYVFVYGNSEIETFQAMYSRLAESREAKLLCKERMCTLWRFSPVAKP